MTHLVETARWEDGIYQFETSDPVVGGPDGIDNLPTRQLANRTLYLKGQVEARQSDLAAHVGAGNPHPQYATKTDLAQRIADLVGQSPAALDTLYKLASAIGNDPAFSATVNKALALKAPIGSIGNFSRFLTYSRSASLTTDVAGACVDWFGPDDGALALPAGSSLPEGASARFFNYGEGSLRIVASGKDDFIYAGVSDADKSITLNRGENVVLMFRGTTEIDVIGGSHSLNYASGTSLVSSPPQFDNSRKLATTAFVQRALGGFSGAINAGTGITLTAAHAGLVVYSINAPTVKLPLVSTVPEGAAFFIAAAGTIVTQGGDVLYSASGSPVGASYVTGPTPTSPAPALIVRNGGVWQILMGSSSLKADSLFAAMFATTGFQRLPSGLIIQWGGFMSSGTGNPNATITFPLAFPNACLSVSPTVGGGSIGNFTVQIYAATEGGATLSCQNNSAMSSGVGGNYVAIGF